MLTEDPSHIWKPGKTLKDVEKQAFIECLNYHNGNVTHVAKSLGVCIRTARYKLRMIEQGVSRFKDMKTSRDQSA